MSESKREKLRDKDIQKAADEAIRTLKAQLPNADLYELGAIFLSCGAFLIVSALPDLKDSLKESALIAHQLLNQDGQNDRRIIQTDSTDH